MKKLIKTLIILFFGTLVLCSRTQARSLDSGIPIPKEYTRSMVAEFIGENVNVSFVEGYSDNKVTLYVMGILFDRIDRKGFVLLGLYKHRNRVVIPIEKIYLIEEIK